MNEATLFTMRFSSFRLPNITAEEAVPQPLRVMELHLTAVDDAQALTGHSARILAKSAQKAALATLRHDTAGPFVSLVTVATDLAGAPLMLLSSLAWHTRNLTADSRASLLLDGTGADGDPLEGARVSLWGSLIPDDKETSRDRFLAHHPSSALYAGFSDFRIYRLDIEGGHSVAGFGRISSFARSDYLLPADSLAEIAEASAHMVQHMNDDHADAVALYAKNLLKAEGGNWKMSTLDPDGFDLVSGRTVLRYNFANPILTRDAMRKELVRLVQVARAVDEAAADGQPG